MEPRGCNRWQSVANRPALETAKTSEICCDRLVGCVKSVRPWNRCACSGNRICAPHRHRKRSEWSCANSNKDRIPVASPTGTELPGLGRWSRLEVSMEPERIGGARTTGCTSRLYRYSPPAPSQVGTNHLVSLPRPHLIGNRSQARARWTRRDPQSPRLRSAPCHGRCDRVERFSDCGFPCCW
jgi:hypothetical protein